MDHTRRTAWAALAAAHTGILTTLRADGTPVPTPVWFLVEGRTVLVAPGSIVRFREVSVRPLVD